jgi:hypothetical protein
MTSIWPQASSSAMSRRSAAQRCCRIRSGTRSAELAAAAGAAAKTFTEAQ